MKIHRGQLRHIQATVTCTAAPILIWALGSESWVPWYRLVGGTILILIVVILLQAVVARLA